MSVWVSVEHSLPDKNDEVLVVGRWAAPRVQGALFTGEKFVLGSSILKNVTHWRKAPKSPDPYAKKKIKRSKKDEDMD